MNYKEQLSNLLSTRANLDAQQISSMLEVPPEMEMGDFALPCFKLAKVMAQSAACHCSADRRFSW